MKDALKLFAIWFVSGLSTAVIAAMVLRPLAGLFFLIVVVGLLAMTVAPVIHIALRRTKLAKHSGGAMSPILVVLMLLVAMSAFLMISGWFNFD